MVPHPLSPKVEDEATALEHEHINGISIEKLKTDNDPVVSRGAVDQYPIIVDSDDQRSPLHVNVNTSTKRGTAPHEGSSSDDSTGPVTPPPLHRKEARRPSPPPKPKNVSFEETAPPVSGVASRNHSRGRPYVTPLETGFGGELHAMATGKRREPSSYSYSRTPTSENFTTDKTAPLSVPAQFIPSTTQPDMTRETATATATKSFQSPRDGVSINSQFLDSNRDGHNSQSSQRSKSRPRDFPPTTLERPLSQTYASSGTVVGAPPFEPGRPDRHATVNNRQWQQSSESHTMTPPRSRRSSRESLRNSSGEDRYVSRHSDRSSRPAQGKRDSAYTSPYGSADESQHRHHSRRETEGRDIESRVQRPPSQRVERPHTDAMYDQPRPSRSTTAAVDDTSLHTKDVRWRNGHLAPGPPITPQTADVAKSMEDCFAQAFKDNYSRSSRHGSAVRKSTSTLPSPLTSPPRTPTFERESKDFFDISPTKIRTPQRSRPPSMDEAQIMELKSHGSLLSAATTGAAMAARSSADLSRSGASSAEHSSSNPNSKNASTPRSRRPSPVLEESRSPMRPEAYLQGEARRANYSTLPSTNEGRPLSRGNIAPQQLSMPPQIQRAYSYAGHGHTQSSTLLQNGMPLDPRHSAIPTIASNRASFHSRAGEGDLRSPGNTPLPPCPRSVPTSGYRDWTSIKEMSNIDICPTCMTALYNSRYHDLFVPSLPRPYNQPSVCAMSKPWLRIAFLQSVRQNRPDLDLISKLSILPTGVKPCADDNLDLRSWFEIIDPATKEAVPGFAACSACVRAVDTLFPVLEQSFSRPRTALNQEKQCSLRISSKHFPNFINHLEETATRCRGRRWRPVDIQPLADYLRKATRFPECLREKMLTTRAWHFMPDLPEFTVCEECYEEVVWPLSDRPIAREISKVTKLVPLRRNSVGIHGISCQLYSDRMRSIFREAVASRSIDHLRQEATIRQAAQQRLLDLNKLYEQDKKCGIDRRAEIERNDGIWRSME